MNIGIVGAGGVGGMIAALLLSNGNKVYLSARGEHAQAISKNGIKLEFKGKSYHEQPTAVITDDLTPFSNCDIILLTVKMYDLEEMCQKLKPVLKPGAALVTLQNGVEAPDMVASYFGVENAVGGTIITSARIESPGLIVHEGANLKVTIDGKNPIATEFSPIANASGVTCELTNDIEASLWKKLIRLASVSGVTCLTRKPFGWTNKNPKALSFLKSLIEEAYQVAVARGVKLPESTVQDSYDGLASHGIDSFKPSMLVDLERGKRLEVNYLSGAVSRLGKEKNIPTPHSDAVVVALGPYENPAAT